MKSLHLLAAPGIYTALLAVLVSPSLLAGTVVIDFESVAPGDYPVYSEDGYTLTPSIGNVRIDDFFNTGNNTASPSFGFGQGTDSSFTFTRDDSVPFSISSIDLVEATVSPDTFGITLTGTKSDASTVSQSFTLDGVAGAETFALSGDFTDLVSLKIGEDVANGIFIEIVDIDNVVLSAVPVPAAAWLFGSGLLGFVGLSVRDTRRA